MASVTGIKLCVKTRSKPLQCFANGGLKPEILTEREKVGSQTQKKGRWRCGLNRACVSVAWHSGLCECSVALTRRGAPE